LPGGIAWYRTDIKIPIASKDEKLYLYFEGVYNKSEVFINGKWLGYRPNGYVSFMYDITPYVKVGEKNVIAVKVNHSEDADSRWYTGSGIYRPVHLVSSNKVHIDLWGVSYETAVKNNEATISVQTSVMNDEKKRVEIKVIQQLLDNNNKVVSTFSSSSNINGISKGELTSTLKLKNPQLWGIEKPYLYQLNTKVYKGDILVDETRTNVGIRTLTFDANKGFALNGKWMKVKGVCLHHDAGVLGAAVYKYVWHERLLSLKEIGCNAIRMSHNPQATCLYDLCDELGFLVMDEAFDEWEYPKKKWIEGWNAGTPGFQGAAEYFRQWGKIDLAAMVKRDRNHPSIFMWSIGNEVDYPNDPYSHPVLDSASIGQQFTRGYLTSQPNANRLGDIAKELAADVRSLDPSRPVTAALAGAVMSNETDYPGALDVVGYNYTEDRYDMDHKKYPNRVLYGSETRHDLPAWKAVRDKDFIFGQFIWTGFDYLGEAGRYPSRGFTTGMVDLANNIKARGYWRKALWSNEPMIYVGTYPIRGKSNYLSMDARKTWNYENGKKVRVVTYSNCAETALFLNGEMIGEKIARNDETAITHWDVPFSTGVLVAVGYNEDKVIVSDTIATSQQAAEIRVKTNKKILDGRGDVTMIKLEVYDKEGRFVSLSDNDIFYKISNSKVLKVLAM
jgi:beta-galactosidase